MTTDDAFTTVIEFLERHADTLDRWAEQSLKGWSSTHQVVANTEAANACRRMAAQMRQAREAAE